MTFPAWVFVHTAAVEKFQGRTSDGADGFDPPVERGGWFDDERKVIVSADGEQVVSVATWFTSLADADLYLFGTRVTGNGRSALVAQVKRRDSGSLGMGAYLEVDLV